MRHSQPKRITVSGLNLICGLKCVNANASYISTVVPTYVTNQLQEATLITILIKSRLKSRSTTQSPVVQTDAVYCERVRDDHCYDYEYGFCGFWV